MSKIISKEDFLGKYLLGTKNPQVVTVNSNIYLFRVKSDNSFCNIGREIEFGLNGGIDICPGKNKIGCRVEVLKGVFHTLTIKFPIEVNKNGCFDVEYDNSKTRENLKVEIYKKQKEEEI